MSLKPLPQELQVARTKLSRKHSYIASVLWSLCFKEIPGLGTLGVDKYWRCVYDPCILEWKPDVLESALFHEINHLLRDHPKRTESMAGVELNGPVTDPATQEVCQKMNIAEDMEINPDLEACGFTVPEGWLLPKMFKLPNGKLAEEYYHMLPDDPSQQGKAGGGKQGTGEGKCGSCAGNRNEGEEDTPAPGEGMSQAERDMIMRDVAKQVEQAAKQRGDVPAGLQRWANDLLHPQVKWSKELASVVRRSIIEVMGKQDYTYKRPSRKAGCLDQRIITPGMKAFVPTVAIVFDTSGSMGETDLAKAVAECKGVLNTLGGTGYGITEIAVDCSVAVKKRINSHKKLELGGGGGTDMGVGIREAETVKPKPNVVIVITDGYTPWPTEEPPFKVIVVLTNSGAADQVPDFYKTIVVN